MIRHKMFRDAARGRLYLRIEAFAARVDIRAAFRGDLPHILSIAAHGL
jgi:hypothetical protein